LFSHEFHVLIASWANKLENILFAVSSTNTIKVYKTVLDACNQEEIELPILEVRDVKKVSLVLITGDRGLCGSYNSAVIKQTTKRINKLTEQGIAVSMTHRQKLY
jgi:F0F1-type ATP synthase gamma subunit